MVWPFYTRISRKDFSVLLHVNKIHMFHVLLFWYWKWRFCEKNLLQNCNKAIHHLWTYWNNNSEWGRSQINSRNQSKLFMMMENSILILITNNISISIRLRINFKSIFVEIEFRIKKRHWNSYPLNINNKYFFKQQNDMGY